MENQPYFIEMLVLPSVALVSFGQPHHHNDVVLWIRLNGKVTTTAVLILTLLYLFWRWWRVRIQATKPFFDLPTLPNKHFFWGHLLFLSKLDFEAATKIAKEFANEYGLLGYWVFGQRSFWASHWEDARTILLGTDFRTLVPLVKHHLGMALGPRNILLLKGRTWKFHRTSILKSLVRITSGTQQQVAVAQVISNLIQSLHNKLKDVGSIAGAVPSAPFLELDIVPVMKMITMDVFGKTALSTDFQCCQQMAPSPLASAFDFLGAELTRRVRAPLSIANFWYSLPTKLNRKHHECRTRLQSFLSQLIQERRVSSQTANSGDLLSLLIQAHDEAKEKGEEGDMVSDQTFTDVLLSLVFAGYDTTSICLTYAFYLLASHPVEQHYCWEEVRRVVAVDTTITTATTTTASHLSHMNMHELVFCKAVILEALRLFPPVFFVNRSIDKELPLRGGFIAPAGANAVVPVWTLQRMEHNFPYPNDFRPDRWAKKKQQASEPHLQQQRAVVWIDRSEEEENDSSSCDPQCIPLGNLNALFAFSAGSRSCPGQKFAMQEAILALAGLVMEFEFHLVPGYVLQPVRQGLVQSPKGGLPLRIIPRCQNHE